ncbi:hypothetical protein ACFLUF_00335 [Chloroflexota bacterium]
MANLENTSFTVLLVIAFPPCVRNSLLESSPTGSGRRVPLDSRLYKTRREIEKRLEVAFRMVILAETSFDNPPEQINRLIVQLLKLPDNTRLVISKIEGRIAIENEKLSSTSYMNHTE